MKKFSRDTIIITISLIVFAVLIIMPFYILCTAYSLRMKDANTPIVVPYAVVDIPPGTEITESMIGTREVLPAMLDYYVIRDENKIIGMRVKDNRSIPEGSLFYIDYLTDK